MLHEVLQRFIGGERKVKVFTFYVLLLNFHFEGLGMEDGYYVHA